MWGWGGECIIIHVWEKPSTLKASHHDVVRLEVLVDDALAVHVSEAFTHSINNGDYDWLC